MSHTHGLRILKRPRTKVYWAIAVPKDIWAQIRELAHDQETSLSKALTYLMESVADEMMFPERGLLEPKVTMPGSSRFHTGHYFIPQAIVDKLLEWQRRGYSMAYVQTEVVRAGIQKLQEGRP